MGYTGNKPTNVVDVSETQSLTVDGDLTVDTDTLKVDSTNNRVGIGTISPAALLHCKTGTDENFRISSDSGVRMQAMNDAASAINTLKIGGNPLIFLGSGGVESTRIVSSGQVCVNTTAGEGNAKLSVVNSSNPAISARNSAGSGASLISFINSTNASFIGSITNASDNSVAYNTTSDYRLKENISLISDAITRVKKLKSYRFNFISSPSTTVDGFLAHEAQTVVPEAVTGTKDETEAIGDVKDADGNVVESKVVKPDTLQEGYTWTETETRPVYQGIDQAKLVPVLTAALQEAIAKIETLETKVAALEG